MSTSTIIWSDPNGKDVNPSHYMGMIGSLLYLNASRYDIILTPAFVLDINPPQNNLTLDLSKEYLDI